MTLPKGSYQHGQQFCVDPHGEHMENAKEDARAAVTDTLDIQHQKLIDLCSRVAESVNDDQPGSSERFHMVLNDVGDYAFLHFQTEEAFLSRHNYPQLDEHKAEHMGLLAQLSQILFAANCAANTGFLDKAGIYRMFSAWLSEHMLGPDKQCLDFLQARSMGAATA